MEKQVKVTKEGEILKLEISIKLKESSKIEVKKDFEVKNELENLKVPVIVATNRNSNDIVVEDHGDKGFLIRTSRGIYDINILEGDM
jgi:hypothetical protein